MRDRAEIDHLNFGYMLLDEIKRIELDKKEIAFDLRGFVFPQIELRDLTFLKPVYLDNSVYRLRELYI